MVILLVDHSQILEGPLGKVPHRVVTFDVQLFQDVLLLVQIEPLSSDFFDDGTQKPIVDIGILEVFPGCLAGWGEMVPVFIEFPVPHEKFPNGIGRWDGIELPVPETGGMA